MVCLDVARLIASIWADFEFLIFLVVVDEIIIRQLLDQEIDWARGSQVDVMDGWLGHHIQTIVEVRSQKDLQLLEVVAGVDRRVVLQQFGAHRLQFPLGIHLLLAQLDFFGEVISC